MNKKSSRQSAALSRQPKDKNLLLTSRSRPGPEAKGWRLGVGMLVLLLLVGCSHKEAEIPEMTDPPVMITVSPKNLPETVPAYGIVNGGALEVNIEAEDAPRVQPGQRAVAKVGSEASPVECQVLNVLRGVNTATGQAIAWLKPLSSAPLPAREFVSADITVGIHYHALAVPHEAVLIRDGKTFVIQEQKEEKEEAQGGEAKAKPKDETAKPEQKVEEKKPDEKDKDDEGKPEQKSEEKKPEFSPVEVKVGISSGQDTEILSGLRVGDSVVAQAGIGYLFPDFKDSGD